MAGYIGSKAVNLSTTGADINGNANIDGDLSFRDNDKAIFGAGSDLQIYHDGSNSYIDEQGTGNLNVRGTNLVLGNASGSNSYLAANDGGGVYLYHAGQNKIETTSTGVAITGNIANSSGDLTLDVVGDIVLDADGGDIRLSDAGTQFGKLSNSSTDLVIESLVSDRDMVFKGNDGGSTITALTLDMSQAGRATFNEGIVLKASTGGDFGVNINTASGDSMKLQVVDTGSAGAANGVITVTDGDLILSPSANVGIGTTSPSANLEIAQSGNNVGLLVAGGGYNYTAKFESSDAEANIIIEDSNSTNDGNMIGVATNDMYFITNASERMRIDSSGNVGIGTISIAGHSNHTNLFLGGTGAIHVEKAAIVDASLHFSQNAHVDTDGSWEYRITDEATNYYQNAGTHVWRYAASGTAGNDISWSEAMRIDTSGNLLVGKTSTSTTVAGIVLNDDGRLYATGEGGSGHEAARFTRLTNDGDIIKFYKDSTTVGSIGSNSGYLYIGSPQGNDAFLLFGADIVSPATSTGANRDNAIDLGHSSARFDDIYATNGTIQTSDRNEKQDIAELSDAEQRVAVAAKGLLRKFRWKDAVAEKGDEARTHFGIIAQDLQAAFAAEGLDAGDYAMFISSTWTDEETGEERTRMGVRYSELLAFIIGAL